MIEFVQQGATCHLKGQLSQTQVIALWPQRHSLLSESTSELSLAQLEYSDSAGVAFLLALVRDHQGPLRLCAPSAQLKKLIDLYDLQSFFSEATH
ncbi:MAG: STAS domain-containing protein [Shewanella sp.]|uniref:STAS domain-containing protein n=1 Tax=Shewanella sp. TaxID=50422 RepID=UPI003F356C96